MRKGKNKVTPTVLSFNPFVPRKGEGIKEKEKKEALKYYEKVHLYPLYVKEDLMKSGESKERIKERKKKRENHWQVNQGKVTMRQFRVRIISGILCLMIIL